MCPAVRIPSHVKEKTGHYKANPQRRNHREPEVKPGRPDPPQLETEKALKDWQQAVDVLSEMRVLTIADWAILEQFARAIDTQILARADWIANGMLNEHGRKRSSVTMEEKARDQIVKILGELGLTPATRQKLIAMPDGQDIKGWDEILKVAG